MSLPVRPPEPGGPLAAGPFTQWLAGMADALAGDADADVPCGTCTACCRASQFVPIGPEEVETLAAVPEALQFPAPGLPPGHVLLPYDEHGRCPMLGEAGCTIYDRRPRTCRSYDCRVFPATGVALDDPAKGAIAAQAARWRFDHPTPADRADHDALRAVAARLTADPGAAPPDRRPRNATERAVVAVEVHLTATRRGPAPRPGHPLR